MSNKGVVTYVWWGCVFFFFKQKTAYEMRIRDWSSDVCSSDLDKCLRPLGGRPILARIVDRVGPQVRRLLLNANGDPARFRDFGLPVAADGVAGYAGPDRKRVV